MKCTVQDYYIGTHFKTSNPVAEDINRLYKWFLPIDFTIYVSEVLREWYLFYYINNLQSVPFV